MTNYPTSLDNLDPTRGTSGQLLSSPNHITHHQNEDDAIEALQAKVGVDNSAVTSTIDYLLRSTSSVSPGHKHVVADFSDYAPISSSIGVTDANKAVKTNASGEIDSSFLNSPIITRTYLNAGSPHTWTKPAGLKYVVVEVQAGGGAGGNTTNNSQGAGGGGGGGYSRKQIAVASLGATETVTVGAGGTVGASGAAGNAGGDSSFGTHATATGGSGGGGGASVSAGGNPGSGASGDINRSGSIGGSGGYLGASDFTMGGNGGSSALGLGCGSNLGGSTATGGGAGSLYGGGGSGASGGNSNADVSGGVGAAGIVIVTEYYN